MTNTIIICHVLTPLAKYEKFIVGSQPMRMREYTTMNNNAYYHLTSPNTAYVTWEWTRLVSHLVMVYDNIRTLVSVVLFLLRVCNCLQTLAKVAVSLLEHSDEYHKEYHFSYISLHSIKAYDLPIVLHIFCESNYISILVTPAI